MDFSWYEYEMPEHRRVEPYLYGTAVVGRRWTFVANLPIDRAVGNAPAPLNLPPAEKTNLADVNYAGRARLGLDGPNISTLGVWVKGKPILVQPPPSKDGNDFIQAFITAVEPTVAR